MDVGGGMGVFDKGVDPAEFEKFKREVKSQIDNLTQEIKLKASDSEETARAAAERALEIEKKIKSVDAEVVNAMRILEGCVTEANNELAKIKDTSKTFAENDELVNTILKNGQAVSVQILALKQSATTACDEITADFAVVKAALLEAEKLPEQIESIKNILEASIVTDSDIKSLLSHSLKKKSDIDELHKKIIGSDIKATDGTTEHVDGLIDVLEGSYADVEAKVTSLNYDLQLLVTSITDKHEKKLAEDKLAFDGLVNKSSEQYAAVNEQLMGLLPGAMAAGLSAAYENKKMKK
jgi:ferritin